MLPKLQEETKKEFEKLWNEHDATHFYKDEFLEFISDRERIAHEAGKKEILEAFMYP